MIIKLRLPFEGMLSKNSWIASNPPAEAPIAIIKCSDFAMVYSIVNNHVIDMPNICQI